MAVIVSCKVKGLRLKTKVEKWAKNILNHLGIKGRELGVLLVGDKEIHELNRQYLGRDRPTNVLAFPMDGPSNRLLGDIVISVQTAQREAEERGVSLEEHLALLLIHGVLHLLGYDHEKGGKEATKMRKKEKELLKVIL